MCVSKDIMFDYHEALVDNMFKNQFDTGFQTSETNCVYYDEKTQHGVSIITHDGYTSVHYMTDCYLTRNVVPTQLAGTIVGDMNIHPVVGLLHKVKTDNILFLPEKYQLTTCELINAIIDNKPDHMSEFHKQLLSTFK